jgi:hypothetical protein
MDKMKKAKFNIKRCFILLLLIIVVIIVGSYVKVEIQTLFYGEQFCNLYDASGYIDKIKYFKVMKYSNENADIFYVALSERDGSVPATFLYHFKKESEIWVLDSWECLWSKHGNAEKFFWPIYPH